MSLKKSSPFLLGLGLTALLSVAALAAGINARVKTVDPAAHTITVIEGGKDYTFTITETTKFTNAQGDLLATGFKSGDKEVLDGALRAGTRLSITYEKKDEQALASEVKLRDKNREEHENK